MAGLERFNFRSLGGRMVEHIDPDDIGQLFGKIMVEEGGWSLGTDTMRRHRNLWSTGDPREGSTDTLREESPAEVVCKYCGGEGELVQIEVKKPIPPGAVVRGN